MKTKSKKSLRTEIAKLEREVCDLKDEAANSKRVHAEYIRQHSDWPEKVARLLRRVKTLSQGL